MTFSGPDLPALGPNPTTDEIDDVVHAIIDMHFEGALSEESTRREITSAIFASKIHEEVASTVAAKTAQERSDLAESLLILITKQVMGTSEKASAFDLHRVRSASACGAARQFMKAALASEMRNHRRAGTRNGLPLDPTGYEFTSIGQSSASLIVWGDDNVHIDQDMSALVEEFTSATRGMRDTDRMATRAEALALGLGVARAIRPDSMEDRDAIFEALTADETLAHKALREWYAVVCDSTPTGPAGVDERVVALWDDQDETQAALLISKSPQVAHAIAIAAVAPKPRPGKKSLARFNALVVAEAKKRTARWRSLASALCESYVASQYEAVSQYATTSDEARADAITGHTVARHRLGDLLEMAALAPNTPLGATPRAVLARLTVLADEAFAEDHARTSLRDRLEGLG